MKAAQWVGVAVGVWLMAAPAVIGYVDTAAGDIHRTIGPLAVTFAIIALWSVTCDLRWANAVLAAALVAAPLLAGHPATATVVGVASAAVLAAITPFGGPDPQTRGAGWRGVLTSSERS